MTWQEEAARIIAELDAKLPADMPLKERRKAVRGANPWGRQRSWPYKAWCRAQREYLSRFVTADQRPKSLPLTPLEQFIETSTKSEKPGVKNGRA
ncbi:hypothetical protein [Thalassospira sp. MCCC 1A01428]|uniref:hypothetical protein n=1 Tax=Thalassospira sp. MCCC 1A01428 TaxID=1470575 RepID=UPI000A1E7A24|nr:hypothetical protein [Thalassospira sp. MCCC 1A01428]